MPEEILEPRQGAIKTKAHAFFAQVMFFNSMHVPSYLLSAQNLRYFRLTWAKVYNLIRGKTNLQVFNSAKISVTVIF